MSSDLKHIVAPGHQGHRGKGVRGRRRPHSNLTRSARSPAMGLEVSRVTPAAGSSSQRHFATAAVTAGAARKRDVLAPMHAGAGHFVSRHGANSTLVVTRPILLCDRQCSAAHRKLWSSGPSERQR